MIIDTAELQRQLAATWLQALNAVIVVIVALVGHRLALNWTGRAMRRARVDTGTQILVKRAMSAAFFTVTLLVVLGILGFNSTGLLTLAGAVGLAFSLAIQDILKNFFSGVYLLLERPFRVGDTIRVKDQQGVIENQYRGRLMLYHVDLYRLERVEPELWESLEEHLYGDGVTAVEWAERLPDQLRDGATLLRFELCEPGRRIALVSPEKRLRSAAAVA